jgi:hypothetical protein
LFNNLLGLIFGFGWQAVNVFVVISGFSLVLSRANRHQKGTWIARRAKRILTPYWLIAVPLVFLLVGLGWILPYLHHPLALQMQEKLKLLSTPPAELVASHLLLFNPWETAGIASFLSPAWWFVPAILAAYLAFDLFSRGLQALQARSFLALTFGISVLAALGNHAGILPIKQGWYYILLYEPFLFALGIVCGTLYFNPETRESFEKTLFSPTALWLGLLMVPLGSALNWLPATHLLLGSSIYTIGLCIVGAHLARKLQTLEIVKPLLRCDPYYLYLMHQPFAYPMALLSRALFGPLAAACGLVIYLPTMLISTLTVGAAERKWFSRQDTGPSRGGPGGVSAVEAAQR